jgi:hypothetical protein
MHHILGDGFCIVSNVLAVEKETGLAKSLSDVILILEPPKSRNVCVCIVLIAPYLNINEQPDIFGSLLSYGKT